MIAIGRCQSEYGTMTVHAIFNRPLDAAVPPGFDQAIFGMGPYWAAERLFWQQHGVWLTEVGFAGGDIPHPDQETVSAGKTGHAEVVRIVFDSSQISYDHLLLLFWENHDPTQGDRQGDHIGSQFRSLIMVFSDSQHQTAEASGVDYDNRLAVNGFGKITTRILREGPFWSAPAADQQYLARHPETHCELGGTGVEAAMPNLDAT